MIYSSIIILLFSKNILCDYDRMIKWMHVNEPLHWRALYLNPCFGKNCMVVLRKYKDVDSNMLIFCGDYLCKVGKKTIVKDYARVYCLDDDTLFSGLALLKQCGGPEDISLLLYMLAKSGDSHYKYSASILDVVTLYGSSTDAQIVSDWFKKSRLYNDTAFKRRVENAIITLNKK